jgi:hypothetical protein
MSGTRCRAQTGRGGRKDLSEVMESQGTELIMYGGGKSSPLKDVISSTDGVNRDGSAIWSAKRHSGAGWSALQKMRGHNRAFL